MTISTTVILGVSARLSLCYENIEIIKKLFNQKSVFIYGIKHTPIDYNEQSDCFDSGILDVLSGLNSNEEFYKKSLEIAELRNDRYVTCLRRKIQYSNHNDYKKFIHDDDECFEYTDEESYSKDEEYDTDNLVSDDDDITINIQNSTNNDSLEVSKLTRYKDFDLNKLSFDIFYQFSEIDANFDNNDCSHKTSYETVTNNYKGYLDNLHKGINFFKEMGINEEKLAICNYNTCELY
jgi:hypothetical protein